jgi:hypothetical protein
MLQAKFAVHLLFFANLLGSIGATPALSAHEALKDQREKCEAITKHCKCLLVDEQSNSTCADTWLHNVTGVEVKSAMACDVTLGK